MRKLKKHKISLPRAVNGGLTKGLTNSLIPKLKPNIGLFNGKKYDFANKMYVTNNAKSNKYWTKYASERTHPRRYKYPYSDMLEEYTWLHDASQISNKVVPPLNPVFSSGNLSDKLVSYDMPNLDDFVNLSQYKNSRLQTTKNFTEQKEKLQFDLTKEINKLHDAGLYHLDLHGGNILVKPSKDYKTILDFKIIDPAGFPNTSKLTLSDYNNAPFNRGNALNINPWETLDDVKTKIRYKQNSSFTSPGRSDLEMIKQLRHGGEHVSNIKDVTVGDDGKLVMNQDSDAKDYLLEELNTEGYKKRWQNEVNKNISGGYNLNSQSYNSDLSNMTELRRDGLLNAQEYFGMPSEYGVDSKRGGGYKYMSGVGGVSYQGDRFLIDGDIGGFPDDGYSSDLYEPEKHYNRLYYGQNTRPNNKLNNFKRGLFGNLNHTQQEFDQVREHELGHAFTNNNSLITPYARDLLEKSKTLEDRSDVSFKEWEANQNFEKRGFGKLAGDILKNHNIIPGDSRREAYNTWKNTTSGNYLTDPTEVYTRYKKSQKHLKDAGIFDHTTGEEFTEDDYNKVQEMMLTDDYQNLDSDIKEFFGTDDSNNSSGDFNKKIEKNDLIEIMNNVADANTGMPAGMSKYGGQLPEFEDKGEFTKEQQKIIDANIPVDEWSKKYHNSDNFRSLATGWDVPEHVINQRIEDVVNFNPNTDITFNTNANAAGMAYDNNYSNADGSPIYSPTGSNMFIEDGTDMVNYNTEKGPPFHPLYLDWENLAAHEVAGHIGMLNENDLGKDMRKTLKKLGKQSVNMFLPSRKELDMSKKDYKNMKNHMKDNLEMRANLMQLRYKLEKEGVYMSTEGTAEGGDGTNPFTDEHLLKMYEQTDEGWKIKDEWKRNELFQFMAPQDIKWMMNNVADASTGDIPMAKYGGTLPEAKTGAGLLGKCPPFCGITKKILDDIIPAKDILPKPLLTRYLTRLRNNSSNKFDIRGNSYGNIDLGKDFTIPELGLDKSNLSNLTGYEINALKNMGDNVPLDNRMNAILQNYKLINDDESVINLLGEYAAANPLAKFEINAGTDKINPNLQYLFNNIDNVNNVFDPTIAQLNNASRGNNNKLRNSYFGEYEKNLRSYGLQGIHAGNIPLTGQKLSYVKEYPKEIQLRKNSYQNLNKNQKGKYWNTNSPTTNILDLKINPAHSIITNQWPVANYTINQGSIGNPDPILNLSRFRESQKYGIKNQHNHLIGSSSFNPTTIFDLNQGKGFVSLPDKIRNRFIDYPEAGKNKILDHNRKVASLLSENFDVNSGVKGTYIKDIRTQEESFPVDGIESYPLTRSVYQQKFNMMEPFKIRPITLSNPDRIYPKKGGGELQKAQNGLFKLPKLKFKKIIDKFKPVVTPIQTVNYKKFDNIGFRGEGTKYGINHHIKGDVNMIQPSKVDIALGGTYWPYNYTAKIKSPNKYDALNLNKYKDKEGDFYSFDNINFNNNITAGKALKVFEEVIPKYSRIKQKTGGFLRSWDAGTLSEDSFVMVLNRLKNPNKYVDATSPNDKMLLLNRYANKSVLDGSGIISEQERMGLRSNYFSQKEADIVLNEYNTNLNKLYKDGLLIEPLNLTYDPKKGKIYIPNIALQKIFKDGGELSKTKFKYGGQTPWLSLDTKTNGTYEEGGEFEQFNTNYQESQNYQRIKDSRKGVRENPDGSHSTHLMADNNKDEAWPTLFQDENGNWIEPLNAYQMAKERGEIYQFDSKQELIDFAREGDWKNTYQKGNGEKYSKTSGRSYQNGGSFDSEMEKLLNFIQQEEAGWDYVKNKPSAVLKEDGKTYYKQFENNKFYPYYLENSDGTFEENATVGFGTHGSDVFETYKEGMDLNTANSNMKNDITNALNKTKKYINEKYGDGTYSKLNDNEKFMLADYSYNLGSLNDFPLFTDAIVTGDTDAALLEYIRNDEPGGSPLSRNKGYLNTYLQPWINNKIKEKELLLKQQKDQLLENEELMKNNFIIPADNTSIGNNAFGGWKAGGQFPRSIPNAENGTELPSGGNISQVYDGEKFINGWNENNIGDWVSERGHTFDDMMKFVSFSQTNNDGSFTFSDLYENRFNESFDWTDKNYGSINQNKFNKKFRDLYHYPSYENFQYGPNSWDINLEKWTKALEDHNNNINWKTGEKLPDYDPGQIFGEENWYTNLVGGDKESFGKTWGLARDAGLKNFFWQGKPYTIEATDDNFFDWHNPDSNIVDNLLASQPTISGKGFNGDEDFIKTLIDNDDIKDPEDMYEYMLNYYKENSSTSTNDMNQYRLLRDIKTNNPENYLDILALTPQTNTVTGLRDLQNQAKLEADENLAEDEEDFDQDVDTDSLYIYDENGNSVLNPNHYFKEAIDNTSGYGEFGSLHGGGNSLSGTGITAADVANATNWDPYAEYNSAYKNQQLGYDALENEKRNAFLTSNYYNKGKGSYTNFSKNWEIQKSNLFKKDFANEMYSVTKGEGESEADYKLRLEKSKKNIESFMNFDPNASDNDPVMTQAHIAFNNQLNNISGITETDASYTYAPSTNVIADVAKGLFTGDFNNIGGGQKYYFDDADTEGWFSDTDNPQWLNDRRTQAMKIKNQNSWMNPDWNYTMNRENNWEDNLSNWWNKDVMGDQGYANSAGGFTYLPASMLDWALGVPKQTYETINNPTNYNLGTTLIDAASVFSPVKGGNLIKAGIRKPFTTFKNIRNSKGLFTNTSLNNTIKQNYNSIMNNAINGYNPLIYPSKPITNPNFLLGSGANKGRGFWNPLFKRNNEVGKGSMKPIPLIGASIYNQLYNPMDDNNPYDPMNLEINYNPDLTKGFQEYNNLMPENNSELILEEKRNGGRVSIKPISRNREF